MNTDFLSAVLLLGLMGVIVLLVQLLLAIARYKLSSAELEKIKRLEDTPTVSLCIPARNENHALADCLASAVASDYPKLEIIVLDDCSQDKTSQIIRSFAHEGVRFIQGEVPSDGWLGKNNAYQALVDQAKGEYLVFMSVDTRIDEQSISQLISYMQLKKLTMLSILPQRVDSLRASVLFAPLRYFWQMVLPLRFNTPVATSLWAVRSENLQEVGGFAKHKERVDVENALASQLALNDQYRFLVGSNLLQVSYAKHWSSQVDTAIRLWYPSLHKSALLSFVAIVGQLLLFLLPSIVLLCHAISLSSRNGYIHTSLVLALLAWFLSGYLYASYFRQVKATKSLVDYIAVFLSFFLVPLLAIQEAILIATSYIQYKRGSVSWKGRNVCYPVLRRSDQ